MRNPNHRWSRRDVLRTGAVAAGSWAAGSWASGWCDGLTCRMAFPAHLATDRPELRFSVVTDTHLGYRDKEDARRQWERTAQALDDSPGTVVLHLGDIVDGGREPQYAIYKEIRDRIRKPLHEIPGNHDPAELFTRHVRKTIDIAVDIDWLRVLMIGNARPESHDGFVSAEQLEWLDRQCRQAQQEDRRVMIAMHVPAHANRHPDRGWHVKPEHGQTELYALVKRYSDRVLALLHGHFHNGLRGWSDHAPCQEVCFPSALYNQDRKLEEQQAPGYNPLEFRPGFTELRVTGRQMTLTYRTLEGPAGPTKVLPDSRPNAAPK